MKKAIIVKGRDEKTINALQNSIKEAEGRAKVRTIRWGDIFDCLDKVEEKLNISKRALEGTRIVCNANAQEFPRAYKWKAESTYFDAVFHNMTWRVTCIYRKECGNVRVVIELSDTAKEAIIHNHSVIW